LVFDGQASVQVEISNRDLIVLGAQGDIGIQAGHSPARVLVGRAVRHPHALVLWPSSVRTQRSSLQAGHRRIQAIGERIGAHVRTR
jgi:hypothetical protein